MLPGFIEGLFSPSHLLILLMMAVPFAVPIAVVVMFVVGMRRLAELKEEIQRLHEEIARLRRD